MGWTRLVCNVSDVEITRFLPDGRQPDHDPRQSRFTRNWHYIQAKSQRISNYHSPLKNP